MKKINLLILAILFSGSAVSGPTGEISWYTMEQAQQLAAEEDKKILVYAEASWCTYCKKMEKEVFPKREVQEVISKYFYPVRVDIESDNIITYNKKEMTEQEFSNSMRVAATPTFLFMDREGNVLGAQPGYIPPDIFRALLTYVGSDAFSRVKFDDFYENEYQKK